MNIAFFNNKGGVGKTSLVYHLAWMFSELEYRVIAADFDPQANLSAMFLEEEELQTLWDEGRTVDCAVAPLYDGTGDITNPHIEKINERLGLLVGDMHLSKREDGLSDGWPKCLDSQQRAFRVTTAFARLVASAKQEFEADLALIDVGPNFGAINRAALIACDFVVIPLAPDLFSLHGLKNVGPTLRDWQTAWQERLEKKPDDLKIDLPEGRMEPLGYIIIRHPIRLSKPVKAYQKWINKIPEEYQKSVLEKKKPIISGQQDPHQLAHLKDYASLMPMAQEARKPMFQLKPADGVFGGHQNAVQTCFNDFKELAEKLLELAQKRTRDA